jgi:hypothetical protein
VVAAEAGLSMVAASTEASRPVCVEAIVLYDDDFFT